MHFLMENTEVLIIFCRLPTLGVFTNIYLLSMGFVLPEIQSFSREHFCSYWNLEIFIWNHTIPIYIEFVETMIKLIFCYF